MMERERLGGGGWRSCFWIIPAGSIRRSARSCFLLSPVSSSVSESSEGSTDVDGLGRWRGDG